MSDVIRKEAAPRVFFDEPVTLTVLGEGGEGDEVLEGRALNLSTGGLYVCTPQVLPPDTRVALRFGLPGGEGLVAAEATVVRGVQPQDPREPPGMALRFEAYAPGAAELVAQFVERRLQPAVGAPVRMQLGDLQVPITVRTQQSFGNFLSVDAELPFLRLGSPVNLQLPEDGQQGAGAIRWVSIHVSPETGIPHLNIGIELSAPPAAGLAVDHRAAGAAAEEDAEEEADPVCSAEFVEHARTVDRTLRAQRRAAAAP